MHHKTTLKRLGVGEPNNSIAGLTNLGAPWNGGWFCWSHILGPCGGLLGNRDGGFLPISENYVLSWSHRWSLWRKYPKQGKKVGGTYSWPLTMSTTAEHHLLNRFADVSAEYWINSNIKIAIGRTYIPTSQISLHNLPSHDARPSITDAVLGQVVKKCCPASVSSSKYYFCNWLLHPTNWRRC